MKTLSNVSPFILLLVPVFVMMLLTLTASVSTHQEEDITVKSVAGRSVSMVKVNTPFTK